MGAYHQMGHDSENLLTEDGLSDFSGAILSPVNYSLEKIKRQVSICEDMENFELIFDPQLYVPRSNRGCLSDWSYFPSDIDSADITSRAWWKVNVINVLGEVLSEININTVCSPAFVPKKFTDDYYDFTLQISSDLIQTLGKNKEVLQTALVSANDIAQENYYLSLSSLLSRTEANRIYLILYSDVEPRREIDDESIIFGFMNLISELEAASLEVTVGFCSTDVSLWKAAGANSCATGKFFNLRRFSTSRFEEPSGGGGQLPYWVEESLFAFLRETDLLRIENDGLLSITSKNSPYHIEIIKKIKDGEPWLALSWRHYLWWFQNIEKRISTSQELVKHLYKDADKNWEYLDDNEILMDERKNDGRWIRPWRRALIEYSRKPV